MYIYIYVYICIYIYLYIYIDILMCIHMTYLLYVYVLNIITQQPAEKLCQPCQLCFQPPSRIEQCPMILQQKLTRGTA